jgi:uncharacterized protein
MENPLKKLFPVEEREDGVYIKVTREVRDSLGAGAVESAMDAAVILNADIAQIKEVVARGRGVFEKVGPRFEYYDSEIERFVDVLFSPLRAAVKVNSLCVAEGHKPTERSLTYCLRRKGLVYGIKPEMVTEIVRRAAYDTEVTVAEGTPPVKGENSRTKFEIDVKPDMKPRIQTDGTVDFRDVRAFTQVAKGQVIAKKIPPTKGTPGKTVTGEDIVAEPGVDMPLVEGKNIAVSEDGNYLVVTKSGIIYQENGLLNIKENLSIPKDVDFSSPFSW